MKQATTLLALALIVGACAQAQVPPAPNMAPRPAIEDAEPDVTRQVQEILDKMASGSLAPDMLNERGRIALAASADRTAAALSACRPLPSLQLLERQTKGEERMYVYRAPCPHQPLLIEIDFGKGARVTRLDVRRQ